MEQAINTRNSVEPVVHIAEKSRMNDLEKFTAKKCGKTDATDQNQKTTSSFGDETSFLSHCDSESHYKKLGTRNTTIGTVIQASSSNAMIFEETPENLSETDVQTPEKTRELDLDETEIIELDTQHDLEDEIPSSSTKLPNQSGVNMFPKESKSTYSGIKAGFGSPESETVGSFEVANENKSRSFGIRDNSCKTVKPVKFPCPNELNANSTTPAELVDEKNKTELPTYSDKFLETRKHISGSQDIFCLKGSNFEQCS